MSPSPRFRPPRLTALLVMLSAALLACASGDKGDVDTATSADSAAESAESDTGSAATAPAADTAAHDAADDIYHRPADIALTVAGQEMYAGSYHAAGTSRACGASPSPLGEGVTPRFEVGFPFEGDFEIVDVTFTADTLRPGESTSRFYLNVGLKNKKGGRPPGLVFNAGEPRSEDSGTATLAARGDTTELHVTGKNFYGRLDMTVRCTPKAK